MSDSGEPSRKRTKTGGIETTFLTNDRNRKTLEDATLVLKRGLYRCRFRSIEIEYTNITRPKSFTEADFEASEREPDLTQQFKFGDIFSKGISILEEYVSSDSSSIKLPGDNNSREALKRLLQFLQAIGTESEVLKAASKSAEEWTWALVLAQHVFSKLVVSPSYVYDIQSTYDISKDCPCDEHEELLGQRGDTSFGWKDGWHGSADILIGEVPILKVDGDRDGTALPRTSSSSSLSSVSSSSFNTETESLIDMEVKNKESVSLSEFPRVFAETITFSFLKNKDQKDVTLIPTIAVGRKHVAIHMYDSELDVFLQGGDIELVYSKADVLNAAAVVAIWMTLNYKLFSNGVLERMNKSGLHKQIDISKYKQQIKAPCEKSSVAKDAWLSDDKWLVI